MKPIKKSDYGSITKEEQSLHRKCKRNLGLQESNPVSNMTMHDRITV